MCFGVATTKTAHHNFGCGTNAEYGIIQAMKFEEYDLIVSLGGNCSAVNGPFSIPTYVKTLCDVIVPAMTPQKAILRENCAI